MSITHQSPKVTWYDGEPFDPAELELREAMSKEDEVMGRTGRVISREEAATYVAAEGWNGWFSVEDLQQASSEGGLEVEMSPSGLRHILLRMFEAGILERFDKVMPHRYRFHSPDEDVRTAAEIYGLLVEDG